MKNKKNIPVENLQKLIEIGKALSKEKNIKILLEKILVEARKMSNSDGGTLYLLKNNQLEFEIMHTESKNNYYGGTTQPVPDTNYPIKLYIDGNPAGIKATLNIMGICKNILRPPLIGVTEETYNNLKRFIGY